MPKNIDKTIKRLEEWETQYRVKPLVEPISPTANFSAPLPSDVAALIAACERLKKVALRVCGGCGGIVSGALDFPCPKCDSTKGKLVELEWFKVQRQLSNAWGQLEPLREQLAARRGDLVEMQKHRDAWKGDAYGKRDRPSDYVKDSPGSCGEATRIEILTEQLATKEECLQNLEARIETRRETIAAQAAEIGAWKMASGLERRGDGGESIEPDNLERRHQQDDSSLAAADAMAKKCIADMPSYGELDGTLAFCCLCGKTSTDVNLIQHAEDCELAAYTATRTQENENAP